ncbi:MAG: AAA family ATPase, partial [Chthoniobacterales bacterium]|nr:AAA family ATPase [Chthoniobacterales bacterium]
MQAEASGSTAYEVELPEKGREWLEERQQTLAGSFPIVLKTTGGRTFLQSRVLHEMECSVVEKLLKLSKQSAGQGSNFQGLLGESSLNGQQRKAVEHALTHCLTIVTGGPGTGKTYTLARILAVFSKQADFKPTRIRLAAPTGKAAQRMKEALLVCAEGLPEQFDRGKIRALAESCSTIHALLGYNRGTGGFRSQPFDDGTVLVLDECSMVDLPLWWALLGLMPENGRLILIGDPHQLESVGQGAVFAEVASADALRAHVIELKESHRFKDCPKLKELAEAMREGNAEKVSRVLGSVLENSQNSTADSDLLWRRRWPRGADDFPEFVKEKWQGIACAEDAQEALARLSGLCLLTAHREGSVGAEVLSLRIQQHFRALKGARFFPIIINK